MKSLRVSLVLASLLVLCATTVSAQSSRVACKDGSSPKAGHFSCWGHGGLVSGAAKSAVKGDAKPTAKVAKKPTVKHKPKPTAKKPHATLTKSRKKTHAKRTTTHVEK
jgi:hypothetical protein